jgi:hypothetical protein
MVINKFSGNGWKNSDRLNHKTYRIKLCFQLIKLVITKYHKQ